MEINGLPLHALVIHAAVVFGPLSAVLALAYVALPGRRDSFRWPMVLAAAVAVVFMVVAYLSGQNLLERNPSLSGIPDVRTHQSRAVYALWAVIVFTALALVRGVLLHTRTGGLRMVLDVLLAVAAVATIVSVVLTGDAGAQAMWAGAS
jgi:uncharacterized membrane protein